MPGGCRGHHRNGCLEGSDEQANAQAGALAGLADGMVIAMRSMLALWLAGGGFWTPLNLIAYTVWRGAPAGPAFTAAALPVALVIHMMSIILGMAFAAGISQLPRLASGRASLAIIAYSAVHCSLHRPGRAAAHQQRSLHSRTEGSK